MALSITVHGQGTFTASMEEGPVTFTAAIASVGPQGATGATGATGVVAATAPITYNSGTQTVGIDDFPTFTGVIFGAAGQGTIDQNGITFPSDGSVQTTAFIGEARKEYLTARNNTGTTIGAGKVVYLSGATGNKPTVALALADSETTSARTIGVTAEAIANNADGKVIISGAVENIDTSAFTAGDTLYLSATTAGGYTTSLPAAPLHGVVIGIVTRANPSVGSIEVAIQNYQELKELSDVNVSDRANNDGLFWESSSSTWRSKTIAEILGYTPANGTDYLAKADNLSGLASASTARTNLGLGTMAVETASNYLTTSAAATTYYPIPTGTTSQYLRGNGSLSTFSTDVIAAVPAASETTAGKVELATDAEAIAGTSTTLAVTPASGKAATDGIVDAQRVDIQTFGSPTESGSFTWTKPAGAKMVQVRMVAAGGGGQSGVNTFTANDRRGGHGGGGGSSSMFLIPADELGSTVSVTVGAGGNGGASVGPSFGVGNNGASGGASLFGNYRSHPGSGGATAVGNGAVGSLFNLTNSASSGQGGGGSTGGTGGIGGGSTSGTFIATGGGGGAGQLGGSISNANGGAGGSRTNGTTPAAYTVTLAGGAGGASSTNTPATNGTNQDVPYACGTGGGGGYYKTAVNGDAGGNGGWPGGGGGGGGACDSGYISGKGGNGANGMVTVITYF